MDLILPFHLIYNFPRERVIVQSEHEGKYMVKCLEVQTYIVNYKMIKVSMGSEDEINIFY